MAFPDSFLDGLVSQTDIAELVSGYVRLTKRSGSNMFGLCPFHSEKTPSFSISSDKQIFHCFGCGKGGGAITFIMEIENLSFPDAVRFLARRAGIPVPESGVSDELSDRRKRILELNRDAARWFHDALCKPAGAAAVEYINRRGINKAMVTRFGLGAAPDSWSALKDAMAAAGYTESELLGAGLAKKGKNGGVYDAFRNRLIFPVIDVRGSVIGFSGRILDDGEPKYLNSPETIVFNKSRNLFALNIAKKTKSGMIILVEGNIDVIALHQAGFDCAVASLGTSLTDEQARLLSRYTGEVVIAYDSDEAGKKASMRAISLLEKTDLGVKVIDMEDAKDPDEYLRLRGADAFKLLLERGENHIEYRLMALRNGIDLGTDEGRLKLLASATELLSDLQSAPEREIYASRVAEVVGVSAEAVQNEVKKAIKKKTAQRKKRFEQQVSRPTARPSERSIRYENQYSAAAEEGVVRCLMLEPALLAIAEELRFSSGEFTSPFLAKVFEAVKVRSASGRTPTIAVITAELPPDEAARLTVIMQKPETAARGEKTIRDYIEKIRAEKYKRSDPESLDVLMAYKKYREKKDVGG